MIETMNIDNRDGKNTRALDELAKQTCGKVEIYGMDPPDALAAASVLSRVVNLDLAQKLLRGAYIGSRCHPSGYLLCAATAWRSLKEEGLSPQYELSRLSTFGAKKYSLHPRAPNSWCTLPPSALRAALVRHVALALSGEPHHEVIGDDCTSCAPEYRGLEYYGSHWTAVLWQASRLWAMDQGFNPETDYTNADEEEM